VTHLLFGHTERKDFMVTSSILTVSTLTWNFTVDMEQKKALPSLDFMMSRRPGGSLGHTAYSSVSQLPGCGPVLGPDINYTRPSSYRKKNLLVRGLTKVENHWHIGTPSVPETCYTTHWMWKLSTWRRLDGMDIATIRSCSCLKKQRPHTEEETGRCSHVTVSTNCL
jgi:hypothetical protein